MKNITSILLIAMVIMAVPACCGSKKKDQTKQITLENTVDTVSIEHVEDVEQTTSDVPVNSKF